MSHDIHPLQQHHPMPLTPEKNSDGNKAAVHFKDVLDGIQDVNVSKHAKERLNERNIIVNQEQWQTISKKLAEAKDKGVTDSLVLTDEAALLVSTKNNTVITAMNKEEASSKIFTNINGTILIDK